MTTKLVFENLKNKPMRSLLSFLLIGVPVTLILTLQGLSSGMLNDARDRARGVGADILVRASSSTIGIQQTPDAVPEKYVSYFRTDVPHVKLAMGVINHSIEFPLIITGLNLDEFTAMSGGFIFPKGHGLRDPDDILVDTLYAKQKKLQIGATVTLLNHPWHLVGIIEGGKLARVVVSLKSLQEVLHIGSNVTSIYLKLDDPANIDFVDRFIQEHNNLRAEPMADYTEAAYNISNVPGLSDFMYVVMAIGIVIGFAVVCLSMYMSVLQRTREIGILKAIGGSNSFILRIILAEAMVLGLGGTVLGILMSFGAWWLIRTLVPSSLSIEIVPLWWPIAGGITLVGAALGALYPGLNAARHDPIEALAYE
ncbi:MAG TPA: FtsX-like permease family protein [Bryobacteraceae bacterium]|nr:FtsX-like permease family protein [Bryobacteraceae bacterium]